MSDRAPRAQPAANDYRILGSLEVSAGALPAELGRPKQRALLALLLLHANRPMPVDRVLDLLWGPDVPPRAVSDLQVHVSRLRRVLEPVRPTRAPSQILVNVAGGYLLRVGDDELDADRFEALADRGHRQLVAAHPRLARAALDQALGLWRGPALADFAYEPFAEPEAARLEGRRLLALEDCFEADLALGNHAGAVAGLESLLVENSLRERLWYLLMLALYRSDRQAEALRAFSRARTILGDELGIEPGTALRRLEADILAQAPGLDWQPHAGLSGRPLLSLAPPPGADDGATGPAGPATSARGARRDRARPLIGRADEFAVLGHAFAEACAGRGGLVLVSGEAGIGKTRLASEFAVAAADRGGWTAWGRGTEVEGAPPYWFWSQIVRAVLARPDADAGELRRALEQGAADIARIVPEVADLTGTPARPWPEQAASRRFQLYEGVIAFLVRLASRRPLVLVLDDLQWADVPSLELTELLVQRLPDLPILMVVTCRDTEVPPVGATAFTLGALARSPVLHRLALAGLSEPEVGAFVTLVTGREASAEVVAVVHARTDGNPFFVDELAHGLTGDGGPADSAASLVDVPLGIREVVRRRLSPLPPAAHSLLAVAAVAGREFDLGVVAEAADVAVAEAIGMLEAATIGGVVAEAEDGARYRFSHVLVRDAIYEDIVRMRRAQLHGRMGDAIARRDDGSPAVVSDLARHYFLAAPVIGPDLGTAAALRAAVVARGAMAYEQAEAHLCQGLELVTTMPAAADRDRHELQIHLDLGFLNFHVRAMPIGDVRRSFDRARELCVSTGVTVDIIRALWGQFGMSYMSGRLGGTVELAQQMLDLAVSADDARCLVAGHMALGTTEFYLGHLAPARDHLRQAAAIADSLDPGTSLAVFNTDPRVGARQVLATTTVLLGHHEEAEAIVAEQDRLLAAMNHPQTQMLSGLSRGWYWLVRRDAEKVLEVSRQTIEGAAKLGYQPAMAAAKAQHGWALAQLGSTGPGTALMRQNLEILSQSGLFAARPCFLGMLAESELLAGHSEAALATIDAALAEVSRRNDRFYLPELHRLKGEILCRTGPDGQARSLACFEQGRREAEAQGAVVFRDRVLHAFPGVGRSA